MRRWAVFTTLLIVAFMIGSMTMVYIAVTHPVELVQKVDDWK
jgi:hypothetical protein